MARCKWCRKEFEPPTMGRKPKFCSNACKQAAYRQCKKYVSWWEKQTKEVRYSDSEINRYADVMVGRKVENWHLQ